MQHSLTPPDDSGVTTVCRCCDHRRL